MTHTPGPWRTYAAKTSTGEETIGIMTDKEYMAMMETVSIDGGPYKLPPRAVANARLMAAAPKMLALLVEMEAALGDSIYGRESSAPETEALCRAARDVIAEATGGEVTP